MNYGVLWLAGLHLVGGGRGRVETLGRSLNDCDMLKISDGLSELRATDRNEKQGADADVPNSWDNGAEEIGRNGEKSGRCKKQYKVG